MNRKTLRILAALLLTLALLAGVFGAENRLKNLSRKPTLGISAEEMDLAPNLRFFLPQDENRGMTTDVWATIFNENELEQFLILPADAPSSLVVYPVDEFGNYLNRIEIERTAEDRYDIGVRTLVVKITSLPILAISIDENYASFEELVASDQSVECYGDLVLSADPALAQKNHWIDKVMSRDAGRKMPGSITLRGRGNTTWEFSPKKPFTVEFEKGTYVLGMGKHKKWNLLSNSQDKTLLCNEIFLQMADEVGVAYEPKCQQITLYVDGEYQGVYLMTSKVSVDRDRVALRKGDFFLNWGGSNADQPIFYDSATWFDDGGTYSDPYANLEWPKEQDAASLAAKQELIQRFISSIEDAADPSYTDLMDVDSMVKYYWVQEISMNYDAAFRSTYSYYQAETGKIYMGPVWDMDLCLGRQAGKGGSDYSTPEGWKLRGYSWYRPLFEREEFREAVSDAYWNGGVREAMFAALHRFEERAVELDTDGELNYRKWRSDWPALAFLYGDSYRERCDGYLSFFRARAMWIEEEMKKDVLPAE